MFEDKKEKQKDPQQLPVVKRSWFSSFFSTDKGETIEQGNERNIFLTHPCMGYKRSVQLCFRKFSSVIQF